MWILHGRCFLFLILCLEVVSQDPIELTDVRLYTEGGLLFGGAVEVSTSNGWERVCYDGFNSNMGDAVCHKRGFNEGAMSVRPAASLGIYVTPLPSLACQFSTADGEEIIQCQYALTCSDHVVVICNYPGYLGCYRHTRSSPSLNEASFARSNMTVQYCLSLCRQMGYLYAGVAFGQECYCEDQGFDILASRKLSNEDCFLPCVGDPLQTCGGGTAAGIYDSRLGSCKEVFTDVEGAIASPGFPGEYSRDEQCTWSVNVPNAANITVHIQSLDLYNGDKLSIATPLMSELVAFTGGSNPSSIHFESSSHSLDERLSFTFTGDTISVTFNSTLTSLGAQGVVLTFSSTFGPPIDPSLQINITETQTATTMTSQPINTTAMKGSVTTLELMTSHSTRTTASPHTTALTDDYNGTTQTAMIVPNTVTVEGAPPTTPRSVTLISPGPVESPSIAVIIAIAIGIVLIILLILTFAVLFTTSYKHDRTRTRRRNRNATAHTNAAYAISDENDGQTDSGIYDPGYENADGEEPIYLSIRNDPRAKPVQHGDSSKRDSNQSDASMSRNASVKTTNTDHDYQSVYGLSRRNTERSYISIYADEKGSTCIDGRVSPIQIPPDTCNVAEDGYMVPTPKNSTQIQQTKL